MEPRDVIQAQIEVLRQELIRSRKAVESTEVDPKLRDRVAARFDTELTRLQSRANSLTLKVTKSEQPLDACWRELRKMQNDAAKVFDECLAFIQGALARTANLDDGACALTDALLDDLAAWSDIPWGRFTLLATSEFYRDMAEIIRIRYPDVSLWSVPLAAHEFGHYLGPELRKSQDGGYVYPFQELLKVADGAREGPLHREKWYHLQEHFSDLFATYVLGPAYAAAFILLRMNPGEAHESTLTHPSGAQRVHGILWALDKIEEREAQPLKRPFRDVTRMLRGLWQQSLSQAGQTDSLKDAEAALVTQQMSELFDLLVGATPRRLAFGWADWLRVEGLAADLAPATLPDNLTRREVLNAAWLARLQSADQGLYVLNNIAGGALAMYRRVSPGPHSTPR